MKQTNKLKMIASMAICVIVAFFAASCSNDAFFGFDDQNDFYEDGISNYSYFIEWDSSFFCTSDNEFNIEKYEIINEAIERMGIYKQNDIYYFKHKTAQQIGISEELYNYIYERFSFTNSIIREIRNKTTVKNGNREYWHYGIEDCFIHSTSHYSPDAPSYDAVAACCSILQPNWPSEGVYYDNRFVVFNLFELSYNPVTSLNYTTFLDNAVVSIRGSRINHCVNGTTYIHSSQNEDYIDYFDYQRNRFGYVWASDLIDIFMHP